jgi:hypothetical protein
MVTYHYSREDAERVLEYEKIEKVKNLWGGLVGGIAAYKFQPIQADLAKRHALFRKFWMRFPLQLSVFTAAYLTAIQIPQRMSKILGNRGIT